MKYSKQILMEKGGMKAYQAAYHGRQKFANSKFAQDYDIVSQNGGKVAYYLAKNSGKTGWNTRKEAILELCDGQVRELLRKNNQPSVPDKDSMKAKLMKDRGKLALKLAKDGDKDFANSKYAHDYEIVSQRDGKVAVELAFNSDKTGWMTHNKRILFLNGGRVAFLLAKNSRETGWVTYDYDVLAQYSCWVAQYMAFNSDKTDWMTVDVNVLKMRSCNKANVTYYVGSTLINKGRASKRLFMLNDGELALELAEAGDISFANSRFAQDYDILSQQDGLIAYELERNSGLTGWSTTNEKILDLLSSEETAEEEASEIGDDIFSAYESRIAPAIDRAKYLENDGELAYNLAKSADKEFADSEFAQDIDVVSQRGGDVAYWLAFNSRDTNWTTDRPEIVKLCEMILQAKRAEGAEKPKITPKPQEKGLTREKLLADRGKLAYNLAKSADKDFANSEFAQDCDIGKVYGGVVAYWLAKNSHITGWTTDREDMLDLRGGKVRKLLTELKVGQGDISTKSSWYTKIKGLFGKTSKPANAIKSNERSAEPATNKPPVATSEPKERPVEKAKAQTPAVNTSKQRGRPVAKQPSEYQNVTVRLSRRDKELLRFHFDTRHGLVLSSGLRMVIFDYMTKESLGKGLGFQ